MLRKNDLVIEDQTRMLLAERDPFACWATNELAMSHREVKSY